MAMTHLNLNDAELALIRALREWPAEDAMSALNETGAKFL
jgi:hypothetical protein